MSPFLPHLVGFGVVVTLRSLYKRHRQNLDFQTIIERQRQWSSYLASKVDDVGIELDEFDWIVLYNLFGIQKESVE